MSAETAEETSPPDDHLDPPLRDAVDSSAPAGDSSGGEDQSDQETDGLLDTLANFVNSSFDSLIWPLLASINLVQDRWERKGGNFVLRPPSGFRPKAVLHFVGGAFVGASPHIAYSSLLSRLAKRGFIIVATPFELSLDYLQTTASIVECWEAVETDLALDYGPLPVIGVGHSAGCLFHALTCCLFDDSSQKAGLILVSFNNKPIRSAIPAFEQLITPLAKQVVENEGIFPETLREAIESLPGTLQAAVEGSILTPKRFIDSVLPLVKDSRLVVDQLRPLLLELAGRPRNGSAGDDAFDSDQPPPTEFYPPPSDIEAALRSMYSVEQTLVVKFRSDTLDESPLIFDHVLSRGGLIDVSMIELGGSHVTPLVQDPPSLTAVRDDSSGFDFGIFGMLLSGLSDVVTASQTKELYALEALIAEFVEAGLENGTL